MPDLRNAFSYLCLALTFGLYYSSEAQELEFQQLTIEQGLPSGEVYNLFEDRKGYVWACTEYGIAKHNGTRFIQVCKNIPFEESAFYVIKESANGDLYLANSLAKIYRVRNDSAFLLNGIEKTSEEIIAEKEVIFDLVIDERSNIYFSTLTASYLFLGDRVVSLSQKYSYDSGNTYFKQVGKDYALIKTGPGSRGNFFCKIMDEQDNLIRQTLSIFYSRDRNRLFKRDGAYYYINKDRLTILRKDGRTQTITLANLIMSMELSADGAIWVGTDKGLYQLDTALNTLAFYFKGCVISDIAIDHRNGIWVSTIERGVYYCRNRNNIFYHNVEELSSKISMLKVVNGRFFIGTSEGNLFEQKQNGLIRVNLGSNTSYITDMTFYKGKFILGTKGMTMRLDKHAKHIEREYLFTDNIDKPLACYGFEHEDDSLILINPNMILKYQDTETKCLMKKVDRARCIAKRRQKEYLVGTSNGVFLLKDRQYYRPDFLYSLNNKVILNILPDSSKNVWISTKGHGLYKLYPNNQLVKLSNIPSNVINQINIIEDSMVLLSTDKGLFINALNAIDRNTAWKLLVHNEVMKAEIFHGRIFIATKQGLMTIDKDKALTYKAPTPRFYLESITANNRKIDINDIQLKHSENTVYFNFDILAYETSGYTIAYVLEGPDQSDGITKGRQVYLHRLQPGKYILSVKPYYSGIFDQRSVIRIPFYVRPAFWQTKTFHVSIVVVSMALGFLALQNLKQKEKRKANMARQLAEYRLTAIKAQINPHFISNSLTAIQQLMIRNDIDRACQYIAKFSMMLHYVLKYSDKYVTCLADEIKLIGINIELEQLRFNGKFIFEKEISENISLEDIYVPPLITQPIVENAIWHGLLPLNDKRIPKLTLRVDIQDEKLVISIIDNGIGRLKDPPYDPNKGKRESRGTWLVRNWIDNLNQFLSVKGAMVNYVDLFDEQNKAAGTKVDIIFPIETLNRLNYEKNTFSYY